MATVIPFPITKLAEGEERPFAIVEADIARAGGANIIQLADRRTVHTIRHHFDREEPAPDWTWRTL